MTSEGGPAAGDLSRLRVILERERDAGAGDALVQGGLDALLRREVEGEGDGGPLHRMIGALPEDGYAGLGVEERATWLRRALLTIDRETRLEAVLAPPPAVIGPAATRRAMKAPAAKAAAKTPRAKKSPPTPTLPRGGGRGLEPEGGGERLTGPARAAKLAPPGAAGLDLPIEKAGTGLRGATLQRLDLWLHGVLSLSSTCPAALICTRSSDSAGRVM